MRTSHDSTQVILIKTHKLIPISANKLKFHALIINPVLLKEKFNAHFTLLHVTGHTSYSPGCDMTRHRLTLTQLPCWLKYAMLTVQARHNITARLTRTRPRLSSFTHLRKSSWPLTLIHASAQNCYARQLTDHN